MTMEEYWMAYPEMAFDPKKPTFWPHTAEVTQGIEEGKREAAAGEHH